MIQTLGDVFLLVAIVSVGMVSLLLVVFLYHLVFVAMDLRQVMRRLNELTAEIEEMLIVPVRMVEGVVDWVQKWIWESYVHSPKKEKAPKEKKKKSSSKKKKGKGT